MRRFRLIRNIVLILLILALNVVVYIEYREGYSWGGCLDLCIRIHVKRNSRDYRTPLPEDSRMGHTDLRPVYWRRLFAPCVAGDCGYLRGPDRGLYRKLLFGQIYGEIPRCG